MSARANADGSEICLERRVRLALAAGQHGGADRAVDDALPEAAAQRKLGDALVDGFAEAADELGELADARRQQRLDLLAHAPRHHRRRAAGADRDHDIAAIDDRRKDEAGMLEIVHDVDGQAERLRARRHRNADIARAGADDGDDAREIGGERIACRDLDARRVLGAQTQILIAVDRMHANARTGSSEHAQLGAQKLTRADEDHRTGLEIEEHRQEPHAILASPTSGVDWNYFLYMCRFERAKRKFFLLFCTATIEFSPPNAKWQRCIFSGPIPLQMDGEPRLPSVFRAEFPSR